MNATNHDYALSQGESEWLHSLLRTRAEKVAIATLRATKATAKGNPAVAIEVGQACLKVLSDVGLGGTPQALHVATSLVEAHRTLGNLTEAAALCEESVAQASRVRSLGAVVDAYWEASAVELDRASPAASLRYAVIARSLAHLATWEQNLARLNTQRRDLQSLLDETFD